MSAPEQPAASSSSSSASPETPLGQNRTVVFRSEFDKVSVAHPSVVVLPKGRIVVSLDLTGPGVKGVPGKKGKDPLTSHYAQSRILISEDGGGTWTESAQVPFWHLRLFRDGGGIYAAGHLGHMMLIHSSDGGHSWSKSVDLTKPHDATSRPFALGPSNVWIEKDRISMAFVQLQKPEYKGDRASVHAVVLAEVKAGGNLESASNWRFTKTPRAFREVVSHDQTWGVGIPGYMIPKEDRGIDLGKQRWANRIGWHQPCVARITDPDHAWHGANTLHVLAAGYTHRADFAGLLRAEDLETSLQTVPSGAPIAWLPLPGGHQKFDLMWDAPSARFWLLCNRGTDSMKRIKSLGRMRPGLPADEQGRIELYCSRNLVEWRYAGLVATDEVIYEPAMSVRGEELSIVARAGAIDSSRPHNTLEIVHYTVPGFRKLANG